MQKFKNSSKQFQFSNKNKKRIFHSYEEANNVKMDSESKVFLKTHSTINIPFSQKNNHNFKNDILNNPLCNSRSLCSSHSPILSSKVKSKSYFDVEIDDNLIDINNSNPLSLENSSKNLKDSNKLLDFKSLTIKDSKASENQRKIMNSSFNKLIENKSLPHKKIKIKNQKVQGEEFSSLRDSCHEYRLNSQLGRPKQIVLNDSYNSSNSEEEKNPIKEDNIKLIQENHFVKANDIFLYQKNIDNNQKEENKIINDDSENQDHFPYDKDFNQMNCDLLSEELEENDDLGCSQPKQLKVMNVLLFSVK